ncbi:amino acid ABC transporter permease [Azospirillum sp. sgz302134]
MDMDLISRYGPSLLSGFGVTVLCWASGTALGVAIGFVIALLQRLGWAPLNAVLRAYVEVVRGTPFLVQLFLLYYGGPSFGLELEATTAGILGLGVYGSAYFAEIFRGGFAAVPRGYVEAAESLAMPPAAILRRIVMPTMLAQILPALVNMMIILTKETVILSILTVPELMYEAQTMAAETFAAFETILVMALFYWSLVEVLSRLGRRAEARLTRYLTAKPGITA